jgi:hypothetical protein
MTLEDSAGIQLVPRRYIEGVERALLAQCFDVRAYLKALEAAHNPSERQVRRLRSILLSLESILDDLPHAL